MNCNSLLDSQLLSELVDEVEKSNILDKLDVAIFTVFCLTFSKFIKKGEIFLIFDIFKKLVSSFTIVELKFLIENKIFKLSQNCIPTIFSKWKFANNFYGEFICVDLSTEVIVSKFNIELNNLKVNNDSFNQFSSFNVFKNFNFSDKLKRYLIYMVIGFIRYEKFKQCNKAYDLFTCALKEYESSFTYFSRGRVVDIETQKISDYMKSIELDKYSMAYNNLGIQIENTNRDYEAALDIFNKALLHHPYDFVCYNNRGLIYENKFNNQERALIDYTTAIKLNKNYSIAWNNRGVCYKRMQRYDLALSDYNQAIHIDPSYESAIQNREVLISIIRNFSVLGNV